VHSLEGRLPVLKGGLGTVWKVSLVTGKAWQFAICMVYAQVLIGKVTNNLEEPVFVRDGDNIAPCKWCCMMSK